jgi:Rieske 2Fe-2S family protein
MRRDAERRVLTRIEAGLPSAWYHDAEQYRRELDAFWLRGWLYACRADELAPRDYRVIEVGDQSLLLTRDLAGELRAFHNVCRHRGSELCSQAQGRFRGPTIVCPYHGWTYSLEGALLGMPHQLPGAGFRREDHSLYPVAVEAWAGFVFVNPIGAAAPPLAEALGSIPADLAGWPLGELRVGERTRTNVACNWKVFWENFSECFHCPGVHPELSRLVPAYRKGLLDEADDPDAAPADAARPGLAAGALTWTLDGQTRLPHFPGLSPEQRGAGQTFGVMAPGFFVVAHVDYARAVRVLARGPEQTQLQVEWLFDPEVLARPDFDLEHATALGRLVVEQDASICERNQRGLRSRRHAQGVVVPQEYGVFAFHEWLRRGLGEA